ncbi:MAG TPA: hypothetical protein VMV54_01190 [Acidocella sp.]|nr:hypothetical protein [Acidocella sp.]
MIQTITRRPVSGYTGCPPAALVPRQMGAVTLPVLGTVDNQTLILIAAGGVLLYLFLQRRGRRRRAQRIIRRVTTTSSPR